MRLRRFIDLYFEVISILMYFYVDENKYQDTKVYDRYCICLSTSIPHIVDPLILLPSRSKVLK